MLSQMEMGEGERMIRSPLLEQLGLRDMGRGQPFVVGFAIANWMHDFLRCRCRSGAAMLPPTVEVRRNTGPRPQSSLALVDAEAVHRRRIGLQPPATTEPVADRYSSGVTGVGSSDDVADEVWRDA